MPATATPETHAFQSDIARLLELLSHSLYQNKEIALRELISNASDALDKRRHRSLTDEGLKTDEELAIVLTPDADAKTLTIADNGIGMSREELVENLGTIARSGTLKYAEAAAKAKESGESAPDVGLIGQFGVGFYSAFMLASKVEFVTKADGLAHRWTSDGTESYEIEEADLADRGSRVILHLKKDAADFADPAHLRTVVGKYSTFVAHPIYLEVPRPPADDDSQQSSAEEPTAEEPTAEEPTAKEPTTDEAGDAGGRTRERLNSQRPIWVEPKSQVTDEQYAEFYKHLSGYPMDPLWHLHLAFDSPLQVASILYCPPTNMEAMGFGKYEQGLSLCAKRVLVQDDCRKLLPEYLRFVSGLVDSDDLPLNVSREALQDSTVFMKIQKVLVKKVLDFLDDLAGEDAEKYERFYKQFGPVLREGVNDFANRGRVAKLLRFGTSHGEATTSLPDYLDRLKPEQEQIYYAAGPTKEAVMAGPHASTVAAAGCEVLVITDPVDEFVLSALGDFEGKQLVPADSEDVALPGGSGDDAAPPATPAHFSDLIGVFQSSLGERVSELRASARLKKDGPPAALLNPKGAPSSQMQRVMSAYDSAAQMSPRIMELNAAHPLIERLSQLSTNEQNAEFLQLTARQLYRTAAIADGLPIDPAEAAADSARLLEELAASRSTIVT